MPPTPSESSKSRDLDDVRKIWHFSPNPEPAELVPKLTKKEGETGLPCEVDSPSGVESSIEGESSGEFACESSPYIARVMRKLWGTDF